jgi:hypothetical protein
VLGTGKLIWKVDVIMASTLLLTSHSPHNDKSAANYTVLIFEICEKLADICQMWAERMMRKILLVKHDFWKYLSFIVGTFYLALAK